MHSMQQACCSCSEIELFSSTQAMMNAHTVHIGWGFCAHGPRVFPLPLPCSRKSVTLDCSVWRSFDKILCSTWRCTLLNFCKQSVSLFVFSLQSGNTVLLAGCPQSAASSPWGAPWFRSQDECRAQRQWARKLMTHERDLQVPWNCMNHLRYYVVLIDLGKDPVY
jgi:hypothetical protein